MQSLFVIDSDLFAGLNVAQREEQHVPVQVLHVGVRFAAMIDVVRAVAPATAVQAPAAVDITDAQDAPVTPTPRGFEIRNALAGVFGDLPSLWEKSGGKAAFAVDSRLSDSQTGSEF